MKHCMKSVGKVRQWFGGIMKSFFAIAAFALAGTAWGHTQKVGKQTWTYDLVVAGSDIVAKVQGVTPITAEQLTIPSTLGSYPVRIIASNAFKSQIWSGVTIPSSVTNIEASAFYGCSYMTGSLTIPANVIRIGNSAFAGCNGLTSLTLKEGVKTIGEQAFWACSQLTSVTVPDSATSIGAEAFRDCSNLKRVDVLGSTFDATLTQDSNVFSGCAEGFSLSFRHTIDALTWYYTLNGSGKATIERGGERAVKPIDSAVNVMVPSRINGHDVISIGKNALNYCNKLTSVVVPYGIISLGEHAFLGCAKLATVSLPDTCTVAGKGAFSGCTSLASIDLNKVCVYGDQVFSGCTALKKVTLPDSIVTVLPVFGFGSKVFEGCTGLTEATMSLDLYNTIVAKNTFSGCSPSLVQKYTGKATVSGVELSIIYFAGDGIQIGDGVNPAIATTTASAVVVPQTIEISGGGMPVKYIADNAFKNCSKITSVTIGNNVREIGVSAFYGCSAMTSVNVPGSVTKIGANAFMNCSSLESINIPDSVTYCGQQAFSGCKNLTIASIGDGLKEINNSLFYNCEKLYALWISYSNIEEIYPYAFFGCSALTSVVLPGTVTSIGAQSFAYCDSLTHIKMKRSLYDSGIDSTAFKGDNSNLEYQFEMTDDGGTSMVNGRLWRYTVSKNMAYLGWGKEPYVCIDPTPSSGTLTIPASLGGFAVGGVNEKAFYSVSGMTKVVFPSAVKTIGPRAFWGCSGLTELTLPSMLTSIGANAFTGCSTLAEVTVPDSVTNIASYAFSVCGNLKKATLPKALWNTSNATSIFPNCHDDLIIVYRWDDGALRQWVNDAAWLFTVKDSKATVIGASSLVNERTVPSTLGGYSVTAIADNAFSGKNLLFKLTIPEGVTTIGAGAFASCTKLADITIPESVTSIGESAFNGCSLLEAVYLNGNITKIKPYTFYNCSSLASVAYTYNVTEIGAYAFYGCSSLTGFGFGTQLTTIGQYAFAGCTDLSGIYVQDSTTSIADYAFAGCSTLATASLPGALAGVIDEWRVFNNCPSSLKITYRMAEGEFAESIYDVTWRYKLTDGDTKATVTGVIFSGYKGGLVIPSTLGGKPVTAIADNAFVGKTGLGGIRIPGTVKTVGKSAFAGCKLGVATFDDGVTSIGERAFENCTELVTVDVIDSVTTLGDYAFSGCSKLTTASLDDDHIGALERHVFDGCSSKLVVTFRTSGDPLLAQKVGDYFWFYRIESAYAWIGRDGACAAVPAPSGDLTIPDSLGGYSVVGIKQDAFKNCTGITGLELPYNLEKIEQGAFEGCTGLTSVTFPDKVSSIADYAFKNCTSLTSVSLPGGFSLGSHVFDGCPAGLTITYRGGVSGSGTAESGGYTWSYRVVDGKAEIWNDDACAVSPALSGTVTIPSSLGGYAVAKIGTYAFKNCTGLTRVTIPAGVTEIDYGAFNGCTALTYVGLPDSLVTIGGFAFNGCTSLGSITLPEGLKTIGHHAFQGCSNLRDAPIPESVTRIEERAFGSCGFTTVSIPSSVTDIGQEVFYGCRGVTRIELNSQIAVDESYWLFGSDRELVAADLVIASGVTKIPDLAFMDYKKIKSVTIPDTVTSIGRMAFDGCEALTSITIPDSVTEIGDSAFAFCWALAEVTLPAHLTVISEHLLDYCPIESITIPDGVVEIQDYAFSSCTLTNAVIPNSVTTIGEYAFQYNDYLEEMTIPRSVTSIGENAFKYSAALATVWVEKGDVARVKAMFLATGLDAAFVDGINFVEPLPDYYIISFNANGGTASETVYQREPDAELGTLPTAELEGYTFAGWFTAPEDGSKITAATTATANVTYYAHWNIKKYTITFNANGGAPVDSWSVDHGGMLHDLGDLPEPTRAGYVFKGWFTEGGDPVDEYAAVTAGATLVAQWAKIIEIECWNVKDGVVEGSWWTKKTGVVSGEALDLGTTAMEGWVFLGWSYEPDGEIMPPNSVIVPTDDLAKLYSRFTLDAWRVTFNANGGTCDTSFVDVAKAPDATLASLPEATRPGFKFGGWWTDAVSGVEVEVDWTVIDSDVTFYAHWRNAATVDAYTYEYEIEDGRAVIHEKNGWLAVTPSPSGKLEIPAYLNGLPVGKIGHGAFANLGLTEVVIPEGVVEIGSEAFSSCTSLATVSIPSSVTKIGDSAFEMCDALKTFIVGFGKTADVKAMLITSGLDSTFVNGLTFIEGAAPKYMVTFDANGGDVYPESIEVDEGSAIGAALPMPIFAGHKFTGWKDGLGNNVDAATTVTADMALTAQWDTIVYCTVTLNANGGTVGLTAITVESGDKVGELPMPSKEGFTFSGWLKGGNPVDKDFVVTADCEFIASWAEIVVAQDFTVTFDVNGGTLTSGSASITVTEGQKVGDKLPTATRDGYYFVGWKVDAVNWVDANTVVNANIDSTAQWNPNMYVVTFDANGGTIGGNATAQSDVIFDTAYPYLAPDGRSGWTFLGWFTAATGGKQINMGDIYKTVGNETLYAHWEAVAVTQWTVTFNANGGTVDPASATVNDGEAIGALPTPTWDAEHEFLGWYLGVDPVTPTTPVTANIEIVALWKEVSAGGSTWTDPETGLTWEYKLTADGEGIEIYKTDGWYMETTKPTGVVTIPATIDGKPVTVIGSHAFAGCDELTGVVIPDTVTEIGAWAFAQTGLTGIDLPTGLTSIGENAFYGCYGLTSVEIPSGVTEIGAGAFCNCTGLTEVTIPASVTDIGTNAFDGTSVSTLHVEEGTSSDVLQKLEDSGFDTTAITEVKEDAGSSMTEWTVTFDALGGSCDEATRSVKNGAMVGTLPWVTRTGYDFNGWGTDPDGGVNVDATTRITGDVTLFAICDPKQISVLLDANGGKFEGGATSRMFSVPYEQTYGSTGNLLTPTLEGLVFVGWYTATTGGEKVTGDTVMKQTSAHTLYARWSDKATYTVTLELNGGSYPETAIEYEPGTEIGLLPIPEGPEGRNNFKGWFWDAEFTQAVKPTDVVTANCTCYAKWNYSIDLMTTMVDGIAWTYYISGSNKITLYNNGRPVVPSDYTGCLQIPAKIGGKTVEGIGERAFYGCTALTSVIIPDGVTAINVEAFAWCARLQIVQFGKGIGNGTIFFRAFEGCEMLKVLDFKGSEPPTAGDDAFMNAGSKTDWGVPQAYVPKNAKGWSAIWLPFGIRVNNYSYNAHILVEFKEMAEATIAGKLSYSGGLEIGKTFTLKATANKGWVFAGWWDKDTGERCSRAVSYPYFVTGEDRNFQADFVRDFEDNVLKVTLSDYTTDGNGWIMIDLGAATESYSDPKFTVKGLPTGLKYDSKTQKISGTATKPGRYKVTVTATNTTVKKPTADSTAEFTLTVPNFTDAEIPVADEYGPFIPGEEIAPVTLAEAAGCKVSGLPTGMKWTEKFMTDSKTKMPIPAYSFYGTPTKPGSYTVYFTKTTVDKVKHTATATFTVAPLRQLMIVMSGNSGKDKATGAGAYAMNAKVSLKATADSGKVFSAWIDNSTGEIISRAASYTYLMSREDNTITAVFTTVTEDAKHLATSVGGFADYDQNEIMTLPNAVWNQTTNMAGVYVEWPIEADTVSFATIKVSGLPAGLKFTAKDIVDSKTKLVTVPANTIYGTPTTPSKPSKTHAGLLDPSIVKITVTTAGKVTANYQLDVFVKAMEPWSYGTFDGGGDAGQATLTIANTGKISGKYFDMAGNAWALTAASFEELDSVETPTFYGAMLQGKAGKVERTFAIMVTPGADLELAGITTTFGVATLYDVSEGTPVVVAVLTQNHWKDDPWKQLAGPFKNAAELGFYASATEFGGYDSTDGTTDYVSLKFANTGVVTAKGSFRDKTGKEYAASGTAVLLPFEIYDAQGSFGAYVYIYFPPKAGKFDGYVKAKYLRWEASTMSFRLTPYAP